MASRTLKESYKVQAIIVQALERCNASGNDSEIAPLVGAYDRLLDRQRVLRGRPLPGALRPEPKPQAPVRRTPPQPVAYDAALDAATQPAAPADPPQAVA